MIYEDLNSTPELLIFTGHISFPKEKEKRNSYCLILVIISVPLFCTKESAIDKTTECYRLISGGKKTGVKFQSFMGSWKFSNQKEGNKGKEGFCVNIMGVGRICRKFEGNPALVK